MNKNTTIHIYKKKNLYIRKANKIKSFLGLSLGIGLIQN